jgi:phage gpG-like protein
MRYEFDITAGLLKTILRFRKSLSSISGLLKQLGALGVATSQRAFREQALGNWKWEPRYPGMESPFINIAGALQDFNSGRKNPKPNRFQDRPALIDEGMRGGLWGSISSRVTGAYSVEWGTNKEYASLHQAGGRSRQPVTTQGAKGISNWLYTEGIGNWLLGKGEVKKGREGYVKKLAPLIFKTEHVQGIVQRPFLGITDQFENDAREAIRRYFVKSQGMGGGGGKAAAAI